MDILDVADESMTIFRENKSYCACAIAKEKELSCNCGENDQEPSWKWDENAKTDTSIISHNNQQVYFHKGYSTGNACVRGDTPMIGGYDYYWEIKIISAVYGTSMMIGIGTENFNINQSKKEFTNLLGSDGESWGMKFNGKLYHNNVVQDYNPLAGFTMGSIIGVHLDMWNGTLEYYLNRVPLGVAFTGLKNKVLYPMLSSTAAHSIMKLTFACSEPYSLLLLSLKSLPSLSLSGLPPGLKCCCGNCWWLFPKSKRLKMENKKSENAAPLHGIYVLIDSDEEEENENSTGCNLLASTMRRVLENSRHRNFPVRSEGTPEARHFHRGEGAQEPRHSHTHGRPIRVYRHRFRNWMEY